MELKKVKSKKSRNRNRRLWER